jgi:hypothetical protein
LAGERLEQETRETKIKAEVVMPESPKQVTNGGLESSRPATSHQTNQPSPYSGLALPRVIHINFRKIRNVQDIWKPIREFVNERDHFNPNCNYTEQKYEEIWEYCIRGSTTSGQFLVDWGFAKDLANAQRDIDLAVHLVKETKAL